MAELNKGHLFWWLKKRWLGAVQNDGQKRERERLGKVCATGRAASRGGLLGSVGATWGGSMSIGACVL